MKNKFLLAGILTLTLFFGFIAFTKDVKSKSNFIFKKAPDASAAVKVSGKVYSQDELYKGIEKELYEAEMKVYEIKLNRLNAFVLEKLMEAHPGKKGLTNDQFLEKYITKGAKPTDKDIDALIQERRIPKPLINDEMKERIKGIVAMELKKKYIQKWIGEQTKSNQVEVYLAKPERPVFDVKVGDAPFMGGSDAKVTIVVFSDFQCDFCKKGESIMRDLKKKYGKKIKIAFKQFPLPFHIHAKGAAEASLCAKELGGNDKFWALHDMMFGDQTKLAKRFLLDTAVKIGLKKDAFETCLNSGKHRAKVDAEISEGKDNGVNSTPTFFVNGKIINGAHPVETFSELIDEELAK